MANTTSTVDMAAILNAINGLTNEIKEMKNDINDMKKDISKLNLKVDQTRVLSGSLVEANIRNYFTREYGESTSIYGSHTLSFNLVTATLRLTSIIPPNTTSLKDLDNDIDEVT